MRWVSSGIWPPCWSSQLAALSSHRRPPQRPQLVEVGRLQLDVDEDVLHRVSITTRRPAALDADGAGRREEGIAPMRFRLVVAGHPPRHRGPALRNGGQHPPPPPCKMRAKDFFDVLTVFAVKCQWARCSNRLQNANALWTAQDTLESTQIPGWTPMPPHPKNRVPK
jgi:hypothetical protein